MSKYNALGFLSNRYHLHTKYSATCKPSSADHLSPKPVPQTSSTPRAVYIPISTAFQSPLQSPFPYHVVSLWLNTPSGLRSRSCSFPQGHSKECIVRYLSKSFPIS